MHFSVLTGSPQERYINTAVRTVAVVDTLGEVGDVGHLHVASGVITRVAH